MDDEFYLRRRYVPAFGIWDDGSEFTQCFEYSSYPEERDLYVVAGDLYENDIVTPAVIVVPRRRGKRGYPMEKEMKNDAGLVMWDVESASPPGRVAPKAVDEDLYKISPTLFPHHPHPKKRRAWVFFSSCLRPTRVCRTHVQES